MPLVKTLRGSCHEATKHSYLSVQIDPNYVDASTQPSPFKSYPHFFRRFPLDPSCLTHEFIRLTSAITFEKMYRDGPYQLRVNPSAGALYPTEIYVQLRGVRGFLDGIYHLEVAPSQLTLIYELIDDGVEDYILPGQWVKGMIFLVSCVYFRSSWKYQRRSIRYCFLDAGHHLGAIEASAYLHQQDLNVHFDFDKAALNRIFGFENKEFFTVAAVAGQLKAHKTRPLRSPIPVVSGTDYFEPNLFVENSYQQTLAPPSRACRRKQSYFHFKLDKFREAIEQRRSARRFKAQAISKVALQSLWQVLEQPLPTQQWEDLEIYTIVNRVEGLETGIYRGTRLLQLGDFSEKAKYLCVNQAIARDSAITLFFVSNYQNYQTAMQQAGLLGHRLYLASGYLDLGCTGIGAYFDDETAELLQTDKAVLYAMAIGLLLRQ